MIVISQLKRDVSLHIEDCNTLKLDDSHLAISIIIDAEKYLDKEILEVFSDLPEKIIFEINLVLSSYLETGEYYVISSNGATKDLSKILFRLVNLFENKSV